jgi:hypothetical protein
MSLKILKLKKVRAKTSLAVQQPNLYVTLRVYFCSEIYLSKIFFIFNEIRYLKLDETPIEHRRPLYANLIKFAEIHPTKIRMGLNAPTLPLDSDEPEKRQYKATGTDGGPSGQDLNFKDCEARNLNLVTRGGSTTVTIGARERT